MYFAFLMFGVVIGLHMKIEVFWHVLPECTASIFTTFTKVHGINIPQDVYRAIILDNYWLSVPVGLCVALM